MIFIDHPIFLIIDIGTIIMFPVIILIITYIFTNSEKLSIFLAIILTLGYAIGLFSANFSYVGGELVYKQPVLETSIENYTIYSMTNYNSSTNSNTIMILAESERHNTLKILLNYNNETLENYNIKREHSSYYDTTGLTLINDLNNESEQYISVIRNSSVLVKNWYYDAYLHKTPNYSQELVI